MAYQHILVPVDGSTTSLAAVKQAAEIAKKFNSKVTALCVLAVDPFVGVEFFDATEITKDYFAKAKAGAQETLDHAKELFAQEGVAVETKIAEGQVIYKEIINAADEVKADLVVIGSHGRKGLKKLILGSVAQGVLGESHLPVLIIKQ